MYDTYGDSGDDDDDDEEEDDDDDDDDRWQCDGEDEHEGEEEDVDEDDEDGGDVFTPLTVPVGFHFQVDSNNALMSTGWHGVTTMPIFLCIISEGKCGMVGLSSDSSRIFKDNSWRKFNLLNVILKYSYFFHQTFQAATFSSLRMGFSSLIGWSIPPFTTSSQGNRSL